jgi:hypothetical protein
MSNIELRGDTKQRFKCANCPRMADHTLALGPDEEKTLVHFCKDCLGKLGILLKENPALGPQESAQQ